jgi:tellurium resistance protein TerD
MSLNLQKGSSLKLTKDDGKTALNRIRVELSWNPNEGSSQYSFDLDVIGAVCKNENLQAVSGEHVAFFNQKNTAAIQVSPDNTTGAGDGVDEFLDITLNNVPVEGDRIPVLVCIYGARGKNQSFSQVDGATVVLRDLDNGKVVGSCNISEKGSSTDESLLVGVFEKQSDGSFVYNQVNEFYNKSFEEWIGVFTN